MTKSYAGIGSRITPNSVLLEMTEIAKKLSILNFTLNSGGADGADKAFEAGATLKNIFLPWVGFNRYSRDIKVNIPDEAFVLAEKFHPRWKYLPLGAMSMMARNAQQVLGEKLNDPTDFVICWTPDGCTRHEDRNIKTGGTGQAISIASSFEIPVFNLNNDKSRHLFYNTFLMNLENAK